MRLEEIEQYVLAQQEQERQVLFGNEAFAIGMLQTVTLAASIALLSGLDKVAVLAGRSVAISLLGALLLALAAAVLAAFFRHQYKMWHVKANAANAAKKLDRRNRCLSRTSFCLVTMRVFMASSTFLLAGAIIVGVGFTVVVNLFQ